MKILVIGDSCTDFFQYGRCDRICPEAPVPILIPTTGNQNYGMAGNVFENLKSLKVECDLITNTNRPTKRRFIDEVSNQIILRVDSNDEVTPIELSTLENITFNDYDAVIISDYNKGFLSEDDIEYIGKRHSLIFMDTKKKLGNWALGIDYFKLNDKETMINSTWLNSRNKQIIRTIGRWGAVLNWIKSFPIEDEHPVRDLSGAGDTFLAGLVVGYLRTNDIEEGIHFANKCASWVVTQRGVVPVYPDML